MAKYVVLLLCAGGLLGCAAKPSVSEYQCLAGDWQTIGMRDGAQGRPATDLLKHTEACGAFGVSPDRASYMAGWDEGAQQFCTPDNGYALGKRGAALNRMCADEGFTSAYHDGREVYLARQEVSRVQRQLEATENRIVQIRQEVIGVTAAQLQPDLVPEERIALVAKMTELVEERERLKAALPELEESLLIAQARLEASDARRNLLSYRN